MKKEPTTFGASVKKVVELLKIGADMHETTDDIEQQKADLLSDRLNDTLPLYYSTEQKPASKLRRMGQTIAALAGEPIGKLLQDPKTDIAIIRMAKDYGRRLSTSAKSEAEHHTANTIYYAAIAHALLYHGVRITKFSYADLQKSFQSLIQQGWIPRWMMGLFERAGTECQAKAQ